MLLEYIVDRVFSCVELVDTDIGLILTGEQVASIREHNLATTLDVDGLVRHKILLKDVHHPNAVSEAHHDLEACRMEGHTERFIVKHLVDLKIERALYEAPDLDCFIHGASGNQVLLDASVHPVDTSRVKWEDKVVVHDVVCLVLKIDLHFYELFAVCSENDTVFALSNVNRLDA